MYNNYTPIYPNMYAGINTPSRQEIIRVNGRNGANAYQMAPNSSILLLDETAPVIWLKTTDGASYPTITGYKITPMETAPIVNAQEEYKSLEERIRKLEEIVNEQSNFTDVKPVKTIIKPTAQ